MEKNLERFMEICSTVVQPPCDTKKHLQLAVEAVKIKNEAGLDLTDPSHLSMDGRNPLFEACRVGNLPLVKLFVANGANVNALDRNGLSPLFVAIASYYGSDGIVQFLLDEGADVNLYKDGRSPLLASFYNMKINTSIRLIQKGADVNNAVLPSFCFVESIFALNSNLVMIASGVRFQLEEFDQLMNLSVEIIKAGLSPRTFYMTGRKSFREGFSPSELSLLWHFQSLCLAVGFKIDRYSLHGALLELHQAIANATDSRHLQSLYKQLENFYIMEHISSNPLSLTRLARMSIRSHLAASRLSPALHLQGKIELLPLPRMMKDFVALRGL